LPAEGQDIVLRVFFEKTGSVWQAICLDLDLAVQGNTCRETQDLMKDMISSYLETISTYSKEERKRMLNRKAPLWVRLAWAYKFFVYSVFSNRGAGDKMVIPSHHHCPV